jgi:hypothetical protein
LSRAEGAARGKDARDVAPLEFHAEFRPGGSPDRVLPDLTDVEAGLRAVAELTISVRRSTSVKAPLPAQAPVDRRDRSCH